MMWYLHGSNGKCHCRHQSSWWWYVAWSTLVAVVVVVIKTYGVVWRWLALRYWWWWVPRWLASLQFTMLVAKVVVAILVYVGAGHGRLCRHWSL